MGGLFSKSAKAPAIAKAQTRHVHEMSAKDKAVLELKVARDRVHKMRIKNEAQRDVYVSKARTLVKAGKRDQAKLALRMKKFIEKQLDQADGQLLNLQTLVGEIEWAETREQVVVGLTAGNKVLTKLNELTPVEKVEALMEDTAEAIQTQQEIADTLAGSLSTEDEDLVLEELAMLGEEEKEVGEAASVEDITAALPTVPTTTTATVPTTPVVEEPAVVTLPEAPHAVVLPEPVAVEATETATEETQEKEERKPVMA